LGVAALLVTRLREAAAERVHERPLLLGLLGGGDVDVELSLVPLSA